MSYDRAMDALLVVAFLVIAVELFCGWHEAKREEEDQKRGR